MLNISKKIIKPDDCSFAFGIPTTEEEFYKDFVNLKKDFVNEYSTWSEYYAKIVSVIEKVEADFRSWGVNIIRHLTLSDFEKLFINNRDIIILFSHWKNPDKVEFYDDIYGVSTIIQKIPLDFSGILDLCVCHPTTLVKRIVQERPNCLTKYIDIEAMPSHWLFFYGALFKLLFDHSITYLEGLKETAHLFLDDNYKKRARLWKV